MTESKRNYVLDSSKESDRLDRQSRTKGFDFADELKYLELRSGQRILDAGCGSGIVSNFLAGNAPKSEVVGWDFSQERVEAARAKYGARSNLSFDQKNLLGLSREKSETDRFDLIVCRFVLRHFKSSDGERVLKSLYGLLRPGGTICCIDVEGILGDVYPSTPWLRKSLARLRDAKAVDFHIARKLPSLLLKHGFKDVDWHVVLSEFKGDAIAEEIDNLGQSVKNAEGFVKATLGGAREVARFQKEYFATLQSPGCILFYTRVVAIGHKPKVELGLVKS